jgi:hypothetical protein
MFNMGTKPEDNTTYKIGKNIIRESDLKIQIPYKNEVFTLRYANPALQAGIEVEIARRLGGLGRESYPAEHLTSIEACVLIDATKVLEECPKWFTGPWTCYDEALIATLYNGYIVFRHEFQKKISEDQFSKNS